jgi:uncharacterized protein (DUF2141 family)
MTRKSILFCCAALLGAAPSFAEPPRDAGGGPASLRVVVTAPEGATGTVALALFDRRQRFDAGATPVEKTTLPLDGRACVWELDGLHPGDYAIKAYLDTNGNGRLDHGAFGVPTEPYGFSNDARGRLGPPSWEKARFTVGAERRELAIGLR